MQNTSNKLHQLLDKAAKLYPIAQTVVPGKDINPLNDKNKIPPLEKIKSEIEIILSEYEEKSAKTSYDRYLIDIAKKEIEQLSITINFHNI